MLLTAATGRPLHPRNYLVRHGLGVLLRGLPPRLDPLRAAAAVPVDEVGEDWWRNRETGDILRELFRRGNAADERGHRRRASAYEPLDTGPLLHELAGY